MENIINYDVQGWPIIKMSLKDILDTFMNYNPVDKAYWIKEDDPRLQLFPRVLEDDGMGYGINEKKIIEFSFGTNFLNVFIEKELPNIELWNKCKFKLGDFVTAGGTSRYKIEDIKEINGNLVLTCMKYKKLKNGNYKKYKLVTKLESELCYEWS